MKFTWCIYCNKRMYVGSDVFEFGMKLFCSEDCARAYADNQITEGTIEESDCEEDDAE